MGSGGWRMAFSNSRNLPLASWVGVNTYSYDGLGFMLNAWARTGGLTDG